MPKSLKSYLQERQPPAIRHLHLLLIFLVILQIIASDFIHFDRATGEIDADTLTFLATWMHILTGLLLLPLSLLFVALELRRYGFAYFFPYLFGDFTQLRQDLGTLFTFKLPEPGDRGIAAVIQGLGLGALVLVVLAGCVWFIGWNTGASWTHDAKELHEALTGLVQLYLIGHGVMGLMHVFLESPKT